MKSALMSFTKRSIHVGLQTGTESFKSEPVQVPDKQEYKRAYCATDKLTVDTSEFKFDPKLFEETQWCPVYQIGKTDKGGRVYLANLTSHIDTIDQYVALLDILYHATDKDVIELNIASPGGYINTATQICSAILMCKGLVIGHASGMCASAGSLIWSVCHQVSVGDFALFMWHMSNHGDSGNSIEIRDNADRQVTYVRDTLLSISLKRGFITEEEVNDICTKINHCVWISADEMRERLIKQEAA